MNQLPVKFMFTKSHAPLSLLIMWGLDEPCSHFSIVFDEKIVFHSNLLGAHLKWFKNFVKSSTPVFQLEWEAPLDFQEALYQEIEDVEGNWYDFLAFFYFCWRAFLRKLFKIPFPKKNAWSNSKMMLCTAIAMTCQKQGLIPADVDLEMISPFQVYEHLKMSMLELKKKQEQGVTGG